MTWMRNRGVQFRVIKGGMPSVPETVQPVKLVSDRAPSKPTTGIGSSVSRMFRLLSEREET
jgi:hypothetical protein